MHEANFTVSKPSNRQNSTEIKMSLFMFTFEYTHMICLSHLLSTVRTCDSMSEKNASIINNGLKRDTKEQSRE